MLVYIMTNLILFITVIIYSFISILADDKTPFTKREYHIVIFFVSLFFLIFTIIARVKWVVVN